MDADPHQQVTFANGAATGPLPISQIAIVVRDIDDALEKYHRVLGWGPWNVYEHKPPALHDTRLHGEPTEFTMIGAETHVGPIVVELLQPRRGPVDLQGVARASTARASTTSRSCGRRPKSRMRRASTSPGSAPTS